MTLRGALPEFFTGWDTNNADIRKAPNYGLELNFIHFHYLKKKFTPVIIMLYFDSFLSAKKRQTLPLPGYDHLGRKVVVIRPGCHDPSKVKVEVMQRASFMVWEVMACEEEQMFITGMVLLFDFRGYTMDHFTSVPLSMVKKLMPCWQVFFLKQHYLILLNYCQKKSNSFYE